MFLFRVCIGRYNTICLHRIKLYMQHPELFRRGMGRMSKDTNLREQKSKRYNTCGMVTI